jgi:hypothetical protein
MASTALRTISGSGADRASATAPRYRAQADDASQPLCGRLRIELVALAAAKTGQRGHAIVHGCGDIGGVDVRIPLELVLDVSLISLSNLILPC